MWSKKKGDNSKRDANNPEKSHNPVDYENTKYDRFIAPFDTLKSQEVGLSSARAGSMLHVQSVQLEPSKIFIEGIGAAAEGRGS